MQAGTEFWQTENLILVREIQMSADSMAFFRQGGTSPDGSQQSHNICSLAGSVWSGEQEVPCDTVFHQVFYVWII